jgi:hypothetical protein
LKTPPPILTLKEQGMKRTIALSATGFFFWLSIGAATAQDEPKQTVAPAVSATLVCACRCQTTAPEIHDLNVPGDGECRVYNNLDCRTTEGLNGRYTDCRKTGVPVE